MGINMSGRKPERKRIRARFCTLWLLLSLTIVSVPGDTWTSRGLQARGAQKDKRSELFKKAEGYYFKKRYFIALRLLKKVLEEEPENAKAYSYTGDIYLVTGKLKLAEEHLQIAADLAKRPARELYRLGQVRYLKKDAPGALAAYQKALKLEPTLHVCRFQMGMVYLKLVRNKAEVIKHWEEYRKLSPEDPQGPAIDRALVILKRKDYVIPGNEKPVKIPGGTDSEAASKKADPAKEKVNNKTEDIIEIDDL